MVFTSFEFVIFFMLVLLARAAARDFQKEKWLLLGASYVFYMAWNPRGIFLLAGVSAFDYSIGLALHNTSKQIHRRMLLAASIAGNLGLLAYFKYINFFIETGTTLLGAIGFHVTPPMLSVLLPVGISFFTLKSMSYTFDVYWRRIEPCVNIRDYFLFVSFFPELIAGPIVRAQLLLPQLQRRVRASITEIESGLILFAIGAVKKLVVSDQISSHVDIIFASPASFAGATLLMGVCGYAVQIYCDFSGYSDMAIGIARIMGYQFPENFRMPYASANITEFWRRWHMSLSFWLRDYLYIPLGGSRKGTLNTYRNLLLTMVIGGLWHGASWNFVVWGTLHGFALSVHKLWLDYGPAGQWLSRVPEVARLSAARAATLVTVIVGWVFFRAQGLTDATEFIKGIVLWRSGVQMLSPEILLAIAAVVVAHIGIARDRDWVDEMITRPLWVRACSYTMIGATIVCLAAAEASPFIYFQF
jgi:alginate O-acetyltransferase complex protein AlgI